MNKTSEIIIKCLPDSPFKVHVEAHLETLERQLLERDTFIKKQRKALRAAHCVLLDTSPCSMRECKQTQTEGLETAIGLCESILNMAPSEHDKALADEANKQFAAVTAELTKLRSEIASVEPVGYVGFDKRGCAIAFTSGEIEFIPEDWKPVYLRPQVPDGNKEVWVSIKDKMPAQDEQILLTDGEFVFVGFYGTFYENRTNQKINGYVVGFAGNGFGNNGDAAAAENVTHWMQLPAIPTAHQPVPEGNVLVPRKLFESLVDCVESEYRGTNNKDLSGGILTEASKYLLLASG